MDLHIIAVENPVHTPMLQTVAEKVQFPLSDTHSKLIESMKNKLHSLGGVGLAAPQVNQSLQIIAIYIPDEASLLRDNAKPYPMHIMINPHYEALPNTAISYDFEACYSVSSKAGKVPRYEQIRVSYQDESGTFYHLSQSGFYARVIQHEIDHINGILITERLTSDCIQGSVEDMMALRRSQLSDEQLQRFDVMLAKKKRG